MGKEHMTPKTKRSTHKSLNVKFEDGETTIDYVLVYMQPIECEQNSHAEKLRKKFIETLIKDRKIQIKQKKIRTEGNEIGFYLLHLPWAVLIEESEKLKLKIPLKKLKSELRNDLNYVFSKKFSIFKKFHPKPAETAKKSQYSDCHYGEFKKDHAKKHLSTYNKRIHFRTSYRQLVMKEILDSVHVNLDSESLGTTVWRWLHKNDTRNDKHAIRLVQLLEEKILVAEYPLHEDNSSGSDKNRAQIGRNFLMDHWASWQCVFKFQPINEIEQYFGTKTAFFFAWLGFYTTWLLPMAILGLMFFLFGSLDPSYAEGVNFICGQQAEHIIMCPLCADCTPWHLADICTTGQLNKRFDNIFTVFFSLITSFWAIFFLEFWRRYSKQLSYLWGVLDYEKEDEKVSPYYCYKATEQRKNSITGKPEPYFPRYLQLFRRLINHLNLVFFMLVSSTIHVVIILFRVRIHHLMFLSEGLSSTLTRPFASLFSNFFGGLMNLSYIVLINKLYGVVAKKISRWELHKTELKYEESLSAKLFLIVSFNYYSHAFYIAFLKGRIKFNLFGATYFETCSHTGCHIEVAFYLFITFAGKQTCKCIYDLGYPRLKRFLNVIKTGVPNAIHQWEKDFQLSDHADLNTTYLYLVLQFGFVTLFIAAFPLGPLFAFIFNLIAIRIHAKKLLYETRRTVIKRTNGIGIWLKILEVLANFSVLTNGLIIAFSSDFLDKLVYFTEKQTIEGFTEKNLLISTVDYNIYHFHQMHNQTCRYFESKYHGDVTSKTDRSYEIIIFKLFFVIIYQNLVCWVQKYIEMSIPDISTRLDHKIKKEKYLIEKNLNLRASNPNNDFIINLVHHENNSTTIV